MAVHPLDYLINYLKRLSQTKLWLKVILGLFLGVVIGFLLKELSPNPDSFIQRWSEWFALPGQLFIKLVQMVMVPLVIASVLIGLLGNDIKQIKSFGPLLVLYFVASTFIAVAVSVILALLIKPGVGASLTPIDGVIEASGDASFSSVPQMITHLVPANPWASIVSGEMLAIVIFTVIIGVALLQRGTEKNRTVINLFSSVQEVCMVVVGWSMRLLPYAVFGMMIHLVLSTERDGVISLLSYVGVVLLALLCMMVIYLTIIALLGKKSPWAFFKDFKEVLLLAFSTTSSAAVMPLTIRTVENKLNIRKELSNFLVPIGTTINMDGTAIYQCVSVIFITQVYGIDLSTSQLLVLIFSIILASIGTPGIPGAGVVVLGATLEGVGVPASAVLLIIGVERILGMFRTMVNVTGDITACVFFQYRDIRVRNNS